ncbi:hypothetical protein [Rugamonas apoptosis]|uniref:Uncharacterized protein n=1 Tax=Rugamonas apoptosis TaxID=2758570 RepID=A0A7W2FF39_9BURK|nr:hypothetical protein [Rugamonas apoptosis]MBA5690545.1 hypothetical protein [Rugamonas apoptosis]
MTDQLDLPPALEFTRLINNQFLAAARQLNCASALRTDPRSAEEAIASRADLFRDVSRAYPVASQASGLQCTIVLPAISPTTARLWARLDADDFRVLNKIGRDQYSHVARWMDENTYPAYQDALRHYAPDLYNIIGATRRVRDVSYSPVRQLPAKTRDRGQIALPFDAVEAQRSGHDDAHRCGR